MSHILLKFTDYVEDFLRGSLYMNTLHYFWYEYRNQKINDYLLSHPGEDRVPITALQSHVPQEDMFEGSIGIGNTVDNELDKYALTDTAYRAVGYKYCNVMCMYRLEYQFEAFSDVGQMVHYDVPQMDDFGDSVIIITDENEFLRRIMRAAEKERYLFLCGNVKYWTPKNADIMSKKHHLLFESEPVDMNSEPFVSSIKIHRDCFQKMDNHKNEKEWRIALYRGVKETKAYRLEIGSIRDIAICVSKEDLIKEIDRLFRNGKIKQCGEEYYGNVSRRELRQKFYELGDNKAQMLVTVG
ncbi:MAG: hypothetical protein E7232_10050 [Lachnospiraceae bacterium]|nr:hypothetical protein [Lachnospiraceae bacterium]